MEICLRTSGAQLCFKLCLPKKTILSFYQRRLGCTVIGKLTFRYSCSSALLFQLNLSITILCYFAACIYEKTFAKSRTIIVLPWCSICTWINRQSWLALHNIHPKCFFCHGIPEQFGEILLTMYWALSERIYSWRLRKYDYLVQLSWQDSRFVWCW